MTRKSSIHNPRKPESDGSDVPHSLRLLMQLRRNGITDTATLAAIESTPRELFVGESFKDHAWDDTALPIACGQTISQPLVVAAMTQALEMKPGMRVLEIGTGSGYQCAILARIARRVYTVERHRDLLTAAEEHFRKLKLTNIVTKCGDGSRGWKEGAPFDRIIVTAAADDLPKALVEQLAPGGIMVIPVGGEIGAQILLKVRKKEDNSITTEELMDVRFVPLVGEK